MLVRQSVKYRLTIIKLNRLHNITATCKCKQKGCSRLPVLLCNQYSNIAIPSRQKFVMQLITAI